MRQSARDALPSACTCCPVPDAIHKTTYTDVDSGDALGTKFMMLLLKCGLLTHHHPRYFAEAEAADKAATSADKSETSDARALTPNSLPPLHHPTLWARYRLPTPPAATGGKSSPIYKIRPPSCSSAPFSSVCAVIWHFSGLRLLTTEVLKFFSLFPHNPTHPPTPVH